MIEITGNLWDYWQKPDMIVCITTNGVVTTSTVDDRVVRSLVMGRGNAAEAKQRIPALPHILGNHVNHYGNVPAFISSYRICSFPAKEDWRAKSSLPLIEKSAEELLHLTEIYPRYVWVLPRPGCGYGGLKWEKVKPVIDFLPENVWVISE